MAGWSRVPTHWAVRPPEKPHAARKPPDPTDRAVAAAIAALSPSERQRIRRHLENGGTAYVQLILS